MTKKLTEQWREGTLPEGDYYIKGAFDDDIYISHLDYEIEEDKRLPVEEVLAPVPSYDEYKELTQRVGRLELDNEVLEDVVQECNKRGLENKKLQEQLKIATKALKEYNNRLNWDIRGVSFMKYNKGFTIARKALKEMEVVK